MRLTFLGVRGSTPAPGVDFIRYGGHTSCIAVSADGYSAPRLVLDAGTGLRTLTGVLGGATFGGAILLSHLHWDHVQGIPFFAAGDRVDSRVDVYLPAQDGRSARDLIAQFLSPPAFPITPEGLLGKWTFTALEPGECDVEGFSVQAAEVAHKGGRTFAYRVASGAASLAYAPDHRPRAGMSADLLDLLAGVDVLVHDAQFLEPERALADAYGHATVADAVALAEQVGAGTLVLFHHGPGRTDAALDRIAAALDPAMPIVVAHEGLVFDL